MHLPFIFWTNWVLFRNIEKGKGVDYINIPEIPSFSRKHLHFFCKIWFILCDLNKRIVYNKYYEIMKMINDYREVL